VIGGRWRNIGGKMDNRMRNGIVIGPDYPHLDRTDAVIGRRGGRLRRERQDQETKDKHSKYKHRTPPLPF
jgi:hypothetical protein